MIKIVTITGADDSIEASQLVDLSNKYPFVEWGILVSQKHFGSNRFPIREWLNDLYEVKKANPTIKLSCHLCGSFVKDLSRGNDFAIHELGQLWYMFERVQINFHAIPHKTQDAMFDLLAKYQEKEFIFQYDDVNNDAIYSANTRGVNCSALYDLSGGAGMLPTEWRKPLTDIKTGYAGGISPENIREQIIKIENIVLDTETWIDMETHVRSTNDAIFDLAKVETCLSISSEFVIQ